MSHGAKSKKGARYNFSKNSSKVDTKIKQHKIKATMSLAPLLAKYRDLEDVLYSFTSSSEMVYEDMDFSIEEFSDIVGADLDDLLTEINKVCG